MGAPQRMLKVAALAGLLGLSAISGASAADADHKADWNKFKVLFLVWSEQSNPFFAPVLAGARDAAAQQGINIDVQFGNTDMANQNTITETALANGTNGIITTIWDDNAFNAVLCKAKAANIPVIAYNIDDSKGAAGSCRLAFIGQSFVDAGYAIAKRVIEVGHLKKGDVVFTPVETPNAVYAQLRHAGVQKAMDEIGATTEILGTGNSREDALTLVTQYLLGHPKTAAVIGLGQTPTSQEVQALKEAGVKIPAAGFDVSEGILTDIKNGDLIATVDQQPYSQGFFAVTEMALYLKYGLYPSEMATGGAGLIDKTNTGLAEKWAGQTR